MIGEAALPLLYEEMRTGDIDRTRGDIARILYGMDLPEDVLEAMRELLESDDPEARASAVHALSETDTDRGSLVGAAIANLRDAESDHHRMMQASALSELADGDPRLVPALAEALDRMTVGDHNRFMVARILAVQEPEGVRALARATRQAEGEAIADLVYALSLYATDDPEIVDALIDVARRSASENDRENAARGLVRIGRPAVERIEAAIAASEDDAGRSVLRNALEQID